VLTVPLQQGNACISLVMPDHFPAKPQGDTENDNSPN
jgi:hypothetical protein